MPFQRGPHLRMPQLSPEFSKLVQIFMDGRTIENPYQEGYSAGGSTSGGAALVAGGLMDSALGTDQGGSIRVPAALCGCVGLKPTHGLVPYTGVTSGDAIDDHCILREGVAQPIVQAGVRELVLEAAKKLQQLVATVEEVSVPLHLESPAVWTIQQGVSGSAGVLGQAHGRRVLYLTEFEQARLPWTSENFSKLFPSTKNTVVFNVTGQPAMSIPIGFAPANEDPSVLLPVAMQIVGGLWQEKKILRVGHAWETEFDWKTITSSDCPIPRAETVMEIRSEINARGKL
ncbi:putative Amidase [Seiridium cardinale]